MINTKLLDFSRSKMTEDSKQSLYNYFVYGLEPGGFMMAVLSNNLYGAVARADFVNINLLGEYARWLINYAPDGSHGDIDTVKGWLCKNGYYNRFQKELVAERLCKPESAINDPLF